MRNASANPSFHGLPDPTPTVVQHFHVQAPPEFIPIDSAPVPENTLRRANKRNELKLYRPANVKVPLVATAELNAWIRSAPVTLGSAEPVPVDPVDEIDAALAAGGLRRARSR